MQWWSADDSAVQMGEEKDDEVEYGTFYTQMKKTVI